MGTADTGIGHPTVSFDVYPDALKGRPEPLASLPDKWNPTVIFLFSGGLPNNHYPFQPLPIYGHLGALAGAIQSTLSASRCNGMLGKLWSVLDDRGACKEASHFSSEDSDLDTLSVGLPRQVTNTHSGPSTRSWLLSTKASRNLSAICPSKDGAIRNSSSGPV